MKRDKEALKYLTDIKWKNESRFGFELNFIFHCNPYFKNSILTKMYLKPIYLDTSASKIKWHEGKCLTHDFIKMSGRKPMIRTRNRFFHFFNSLPPHPTEEEIYNHGRYIVETFKGNIKYDYHTGKIIRDKIIPHAISWYIGEALRVSFVMNNMITVIPRMRKLKLVKAIEALMSFSNCYDFCFSVLWVRITLMMNAFGFHQSSSGFHQSSSSSFCYQIGCESF